MGLQGCSIICESKIHSGVQMYIIQICGTFIALVVLETYCAFEKHALGSP